MPSTKSASAAASKSKRIGRRRRGKRDVVLDFTKRAKKPGEPRLETAPIIGVASVRGTDTVLYKSADESKQTGESELDSTAARRGRRRGEKLSLTTSSKDYEGHLGLPDKIKQRDYETTGQFFRRLDRLVAKAKVEADLEARFDITLHKGQEVKKGDATGQKQKGQTNTTGVRRKRNHPNNEVIDSARSSSANKRKRR